jgi:hypothetical protein
MRQWVLTNLLEIEDRRAGNDRAGKPHLAEVTIQAIAVINRRKKGGCSRRIFVLAFLA